MTLIEKIIAKHSNKNNIRKGEIVDIFIDSRVARDFGGANVVKNIIDKGLGIENHINTFFTFDCNPTGSDQKYAVNQQICRNFAKQNQIKVYDINRGIGTHLLIDEAIAYPYSTAISTDSHANILGAIGSFGQGMGDQDVAAAFVNGKIWFKVPPSVKIILKGKRPQNISAKDIILNLLNIFGANQLLGYSIELCGDEVDNLTLDERITISSMATEMGAIVILIQPSEEIIKMYENKLNKKIEILQADADAVYDNVFEVNIAEFEQRVSLPGAPHKTAKLLDVQETLIDSAFIGSCTNGRIEDLRIAAKILKGKTVHSDVVLKIVPSTDEIWKQALNEGLIEIFKNAGVLLSNAGCAGCAAGQVGQNGEGEITISSGNRNFPGKQGKGQVYLASPEIVASSAIAGYITNKEGLENIKEIKRNKITTQVKIEQQNGKIEEKPIVLEGRIWIIREDNIDTDMIFHNRYLTITNIEEMGQYTFDNLKSYEDFAKKSKKGDIILVGKNFGSGSSRQQAVDCFKSLGISAILAKSYGAIYERNAINAAFPILTYQNIDEIKVKDGDKVKLNLQTGELINCENGKMIKISQLSDVQMEIYKKGGMF